MPITVSYDVADLSSANRNYIRSMLERFFGSVPSSGVTQEVL